MFYKCEKLISLPDISKWLTSNLNNISYLFCGCDRLISIPDISKWDTSSVIEMVGMFSGCSSLVSISDLSKWKVFHYNCMFEACFHSLNFPYKSKE